MTKIQLVIVSVLVLWSASALRLGDHRHEAYDNATSYLQGLQSQQSKFEAEINKLEINVDKAIEEASNTTDIASKIAILEKGILSQEDEIFIASTTLIPVLVLKDQCTNLTEADKTKLIQKCQSTVLDIQTLLTKLQTLPQDARVQEMQASANHQIYYLQTIQKVLTQNCTTSAILSPTVYQSNIYAPNWITGNQTINDIVNQYIARSQQYDNITNCPLDSPFYNGVGCINCNGSLPYFDMKSLQCVNCPTGQYFDSQEKVCKQAAVLAPNATNPAYLGQTVGPLPVASPTDVPCPSSTPYYNGSACLSCAQLFNFTTQTCAACPTGSTFNATTRTCDLPKPNSNNPVASGNLIGQLTQPQGTVPCPASTPYYNGNSCIACTAPNNLFNLTSLQCTSCPAGSNFDSTNQVCVTSAPNATNLASGTNYTGPQPVSKPGDIPCPTTAPYFNGTGCINCASPTPIFNTSTLTCTSCPAGSTYNSATKACVSNPPNATNVSAASNYTGTLPAQQPTDVPCPASTPYFNGSACINCVDPTPIFNATTSKCSSCPAGTSYNSALKACVSNPPNATNVAAATNYTGTLPPQKPTDVPCPAATPYFDGTHCFNCSSPTPVFNSSSLLCTNCPAGSILNAATHSCIPLPNATNVTAASNYVGALPPQQLTDVPCPAATPYYNGTACINCANPTPIFNASTLTCTSCPAGTAYNATNHSCSPLVVTPTGSNPAGQNNTVGTLAPTTAPCPPDYPFFNGTNCINCTDPTPLFNATSLKCTACTGGYYNATTHQCMYYNAINPGSINSTVGTTTTPTNAVYCPVNYPFFNGTACLGCPAETPYFNTTSKVCVGCPAGSVLNTTTHLCDVTKLTPNASNPAGVNSTVGPLTTAGPNDVPCPTTAPFFVNGSCIACAPNYFSEAQAGCVTCPAGYAYDANTHSCVFIQPYTNNLQAPNWVSASPFKDFVETNNSIANGSKQACPLTTPYFDGTKCISCPSYFNLTTGQCLVCPAGSTFVIDTHKCETNTPPYQTNVYTAPSLSYGDTSKKQWQSAYDANKQTYPNIQDCPPATPYFNGINCISCSGTYQYFDLTSKDCISCEGDYHLSTNGQCVSNVDAGVLSPNLSAMTANALFHKKLAAHYRHRIE